MFFLFALLSVAFSEPVQEGDIIFQTSRSSQSEAIQLATDSPYSHVGIITIQDGEPMVYEAIRTVVATPLADWIRRGEGGRYRLMRPKKPLTDTQLDAMNTVGRTHHQKSYDLRFDWSDQKMYCSELVWKIYKTGAGIELAGLRPMDSYRLNDPKVISLIQARWGDDINWKEPMVAPSDLASSPWLEVVVDDVLK
jgi:hypothetical protein